MHDEYCNRCPDWNDDKNRFQPENRFVGDIEDGKRYPFDVYKKAEADERFAVKQTEADLAALTEVVSGKADESECVDIRARLDALEYNSIEISSFTVEPTVCELGSSNTIQLTWTLSKPATEQNINGTPVSENSVQYTGVTESTTYTLNVSDGNTFDTASVSVEFANQIYFGAAADLSDVTTLESTLSNDPQRTITVNAGTGQYIIYAIPARLGDVAFYVSGFEGGFEDPVEQILTNNNGYQETYRVYRSTRAGLGSTAVEVREG
jgi:hypothetical protein